MSTSFMKRRTLIAALALAGASTVSMAQDGPIKLLVGFAPGGTTDVVARVLAQGMQAELKQNVIVDNRAGAGGQIAAQVLKSSKPDGLTLFMSNSHTTSMIPVTTLNPGFDPSKDFAPVALVATNPDVFVINPAVVNIPNAGLREYGQWSNANPGKGNVGVPAPASAPDFAVTLIGRALKTDLKSAPYRGDAPIVQDLLGGQISGGITGIGVAIVHARTGKLKIVAVDGTKRLAAIPDVPTYAELGIKGYEDVIFTGVYAPAGTPADLIAKYNAAITKVVNSKEFFDKVNDLGIVPQSGSPAELMRMTEASRQANIPMMKDAGFKPQ